MYTCPLKIQTSKNLTNEQGKQYNETLGRMNLFYNVQLKGSSNSPGLCLYLPKGGRPHSLGNPALVHIFVYWYPLLKEQYEDELGITK